MFGLFKTPIFNLLLLKLLKKMPNSEGRSSNARKSKSDNFVWSDDEVELLLNVVLEYKTHERRRMLTFLTIFETDCEEIPNAFAVFRM